MNSQLLEHSSSSHAATESQADLARRPAHPPSSLDRIALRIGLALIVWSRRSAKPAPEREELARAHAVQRAREQREREYERRVHVDITR